MFRLEHNLGDPLLLPPDLAVVIGRGDQSDLQLNDPSVSRVHCRVIASRGIVTLTDAGSRWGTFVNGQRVEECDLRPGDCITIGESKLRLEVEGDPDRTTLAPRDDLHRPEGVSVTDADFHTEQGLRPQFTSRHPEERHRHLPATLQPDEFVGQTFHHYEVLQTIAVTSVGIVFKAKESTTSRPLALKIFQPSCFADEVAEQRFERAMRTMFRQRHPNIVELYNAGKKEGHCFTASQLVDGESAVDMIRRVGVAGMLEPSTVLQVAVDLCEALRFAESKNIVHRNIKPSNILIRETDGAALLNDLILAKASIASEAAQLTQAGDIPGDVSYMSPEQLGSGHSVDCRSDIYQLGAALYALLTGRPPLEGGTMAQTIVQVLTADPPPVQQRHLATPPQFDTVVLKMLSKNPRDRYANANELSSALRLVCAETGQQHIKPRDADPDVNWGGALDGLI